MEIWELEENPLQRCIYNVKQLSEKIVEKSTETQYMVVIYRKCIVFAAKILNGYKWMEKIKTYGLGYYFLSRKKTVTI